MKEFLNFRKKSINRLVSNKNKSIYKRASPKPDNIASYVEFFNGDIRSVSNGDFEMFSFSEYDCPKPYIKYMMGDLYGPFISLYCAMGIIRDLNEYANINYLDDEETDDEV